MRPREKARPAAACGGAPEVDPPAPLDSRIVEEVVHGEDIRRPLGIPRAYPPEAVRRALHHQARTLAAFGGAKEFAAGIQLAAIDDDLAIG